MFDKSSARRQKREILCEVTLTGQAPFLGAVFLKTDERLIDLLNDHRAFIPLRDAEGEAIIIAKSGIVSIIEKGEASLDPEEGHAAGSTSGPASDDPPEAPSPETPRRFDPYRTLRISPDAGIDEIRKAYKARIKAVHPDSVAALDLDEDLERAAVRAAQKVNHAYRMILRERGAA